MAETTSFTGIRRQRTTRKSVVVIDKVTRGLITVGGIGTIAAVLGVAVFLVWVVLPLFLEAKVEDFEYFEHGWEKPPLHLEIDEYRLLGWAMLPSGQLEVFRLDTGERRVEEQLFDEGRLRSMSALDRSDSVVFGFADGYIQTAEIGYQTEILNPTDLPAEVLDQLDSVSPGTPVNFRDGVIEHTPLDQYRFQRLNVELKAERPVDNGSVFRVRHVIRASGGPMIAAVAEHRPGLPMPGPDTGEDTEADEEIADLEAPAVDMPVDAAVGMGESEIRVHVVAVEEKSNFLTGKSELIFSEPVRIPYEALSPAKPRFVEISGPGDNLYLAWEDGHLLRYDIGDPESAEIIERGRLIPEGERLTVFGFILGKATLVWGDSDGEITGGFAVRTEDVVQGRIETLEHTDLARDVLVSAKQLADEGSPALALAPSERTRLLLAGFEDGTIELSNVTHAARLTRVRVPSEQSVLALQMAPKDDALVALTEDRLYHASLDPRYPEASFKGIFQKVWYEGYAEPQHIWQSSSASDDFEPKMGMMPLIFGTIKATVYSMLFGAPLALLAAIFTSEFLHPRAKSAIKPTIELMASLPSVVLGFLAALVFAPFIEDVVPATLSLFFTVPVAFLIGAYIWQILPHDLTIRYQSWRFAFIGLALPVGVIAAFQVGPLVENWLFFGDIKSWLAWEPGGDVQRDVFSDATGGWMLMCLPLSALLVAFLSGRVAAPFMRRLSSKLDRRRLAMADAAKFLILVAATFAFAYTFSAILAAMGFDPRGGYVDTYVQRNAMIVGFVMGFAIIPIIYTISEDALSTVPEHLRSASLGAGATPWQTAVRIVIPTAMSGLFSAMMIGLGRAVGETMIVLMAAGNTPVLEWNIFEGFRTLSANIAVELPEAVRNSAHYRALFLAALVLFVMTFVVNTVAEVVRLRFRKRAYQL